MLQVESETTLIPFDVREALSHFSHPFDLIYLDPPYDTPTAPIVEALLSHKLFAPGAFLFVEERAPATTPLFPALPLISSRHYGGALLHQYQF